MPCSKRKATTTTKVDNNMNVSHISQCHASLASNCRDQPSKNALYNPPVPELAEYSDPVLISGTTIQPSLSVDDVKVIRTSLSSLVDGSEA